MTCKRRAELRYIGSCCGLADAAKRFKDCSPVALMTIVDLLIEETEKLRAAEARETIPIASLPETQIESAIRIQEASE